MRKSLRRWGVVLVLLAAGGCGPEPAPPAATGDLESLARQGECRKPRIQIDAEELRQANCRTPSGRFILTTFATDRGLREWIDEANDYGGTYLVGRKWVVSGDEDVVTALRGRLGGDLERSSHHGGDDGEQKHSGHHTN